MSETVPGRRPTLIEVAELAGVSHQTVSRFFRSNETLKTQTRERVAAAVSALNYRPNVAAQSMRTRRSGRIAVFVPSIASTPMRMLAGASEAARRSGYAVDISGISGERVEQLLRLEELSLSGQIDGVLAFGPLASVVNQDAWPIPVISVGDFDDLMRSSGDLSDASPVEELMVQLAALGHRRFLHISGPSDYPSAQARRRAFTAAAKRLQLTGAVVPGGWDAASGVRASAHLKSADRPTAIIAANDVVAAGFIRGALEQGLSCPRDISVTGWDNEIVGGYLSPSLTTVDNDLERVGSRAVDALVRAISGKPDSGPPHGALMRVLWRESTGPAPGV